ncbi:hypothetical protein ACVWWW_001309 [Lysobacter sp. HA18]
MEASAIDDLPMIEMSDLYKAYRKAKYEAFRDTTHFNALAFAAYEQRLEKNLGRLLARLQDGSSAWSADLKFIGGYSFMPKSIEAPDIGGARDTHYATLNPTQDWQDQCKAQRRRMDASFRLIILPTVNYLVISALWVMKIGSKFDGSLDRRYAYAHVIRRVGRAGPVAEEAHNLFEHYIYGYRRWRSKGLDAMRSALDAKQSIVAVTMDVERFYHSVSPNFLSNAEFQKKLNVTLSAQERAFNDAFVRSLETWYRSTPDYKERPEGGIPVGLPASRVISNVLLAEFDKTFAKRTKAIYYGRYADDIFLVVKRKAGLKTGDHFVSWLRKTMQGWLVLSQTKGGAGLRLKLNYAKDSRIVFASKKQKIFYLDGAHGIDLVDQIVEKIRQQSSEYRDLPDLPDSESQMAAQALLASTDATLEADALRKAEAVSIRRLGFSMILSDVESYARDLAPGQWRSKRHRFYGLVSRYVLTPTGVFDYLTYIVRVFGLMISCGDLKQARALLDRLDEVSRVLMATSSAGTTQRPKFLESRRHYYRGFAQVALAACSSTTITLSVRDVMRRVQGKRTVPSKTSLRASAVALLKADLARRPYYDYWLKENKREPKQPALPMDLSVRRVLKLTKKYPGGSGGGRRAPYWPAIAFATRPIPLWSLCISAPELMSVRGGLEKMLWATRGSMVNRKYTQWRFISTDSEDRVVVHVPSEQSGVRKIGVPSYLTSDSQWEAAFGGKGDASIARYVGIRRLINRILRESPDVRYIALPECSIRYDWALQIAQKLGLRGVSFLAGLENRGKGASYTNEALVSLSSNFFGRQGSICFIQPKLALAHHESIGCNDAKKRFVPGCPQSARPVYVHGDLSIGVLICSDLTTIANRAHFQGQVDALFVLEWNKDLSTFEFLVESTAHDLHAAVVQVNNRAYGDSRIRMPFDKSWRRDVVQVKGGDEDFYVVASIDFGALRKYQRDQSVSDEYKPLPIGYIMSPRRRESSAF